MNKFILLSASAAIFASTGCAAHQSNAASNTTTLVKVAGTDPFTGALPPANLETGVQITSVTRNETTSKVGFAIAKDGQALAPIVISAKAGPQTKLAADELQKYLSQITGADFKVETGDGQNGIAVGSVDDFPTPALDAALKIYHHIDGKEAYAIRTRQKRILILGRTDLATSHAVYRFLEEIGCRWFFPNATGNWTVIPSITNLTFKENITDRPAFLERSIWYCWGIFGDNGHPESTTAHPRSAGGDFNDWERRNGMAGSFIANTGHSYDRIVADNATAFKAHPEYFALVGGKRQGNQLEYGNPDLRKLVVDWVIKQFKADPTLDMVSVDPADGGGLSESPESIAYGDGYAGNGAFKLANEVAVAVQKAFPGQDKMVGMYAYNWHSDPPPFPLEPNVYIQLTMAYNSGKLTLDQLFDQWPKEAKNLGFYDYYSIWRWDYDMWPGGRVGNKNYAPAMILRFQKANAASKAYATSISAESSGNWGPNGRGYYVANQLMWNPQLNNEAILDDFYQKAFGPAAAIMKKYYSYQDNPPPMSPGVVGALFRTMNEARQAAKGDEAVMKRLDDLTNYLHYYDLNYRNAHANDGKNAERTLEIQTLMYQNRYSYMDHWEAFLQDSLHLGAIPSGPAPWKVDKPITRAETESWLQDALAYYPELKIPATVTFSKDLVPVSIPQPAGGIVTQDFKSPSYQGGTQEFAFYSVKGEPIRATLLSFAMYGGAKQSWQLTTPDGQVLAQGAPQGTAKGTRTDINVKVPKPGRYTLKYSDGSGSLYQIQVPKDQPFAFQLDKLNGATTLYQSTPDLYFYVPKGTKSIEYYFARTPWSDSGPHTVISPDGKIAATFLDKDGAYLSVPVPDGMDGKVWSFGSPKGSPQGFGLGYFHFFNCPDLLSPSPGVMLLPKDLVKKDGLDIVK